MEEKITEFNIYKVYFPETEKTNYVLERLSSTGKQFDWREETHSSLFELANEIIRLNPNLSLPIKYENESKKGYRKLSTRVEGEFLISEQPFDKQKTLADLLYKKSK